jgi:hypothetical protein
MTDPDVAKAAEDAMRKNVLAVVEHANAMKQHMEDVEERMVVVENNLQTIWELIEGQGGFRQQMGMMRAQILGGGATDGNND